MNETIIYYSYSTKGIVSGKEPSKAIKEFLGDNVSFLKCPVYRDAMKNVFSVGSWFNLKLNVDENGLRADVPQSFMDDYILTHSDKHKIYQVGQTVIFIAKDDSLKMTMEHPVMSDNSFSNSCSLINGTFDIGKYFRLISPAFYINKGVNSVSIKEGDALYYLRFHTEKKIKFVPFFMSEKYEHIATSVKYSVSESLSNKSMDLYYKIFKKQKIKKLLLKEIKANLI